jgi:hypothetical protein
VIAQDSGNRANQANQSNLANNLCLFEAVYGDQLAALDYVTVAIRNFHDAGNTTVMRNPWPSSPLFWTGSAATNRRPPSPGSQSIP